MSGPSMSLRGNCRACGKENVVGSVNAKLGDYGLFLCGACWDSLWEPSWDNDDDDEGDGADADAADAGQDDGQPCGARPRWRAVSVGAHPRRRKVRVADGGVACAGCGAGIWLSAFVLLNHVEKHLLSGRGGADDPAARACRVVELGAGCGVPGLALAQRGAEVVLTDIVRMCPLLEENVALNFPEEAPRRPQVVPLSWGGRDVVCGAFDEAELAKGWDFVIGSDIGYDRDACGVLLQTIEVLLSCGAEHRQARAVLALPRRSGEFDAFEARVAASGWALRVLEEVDLLEEIGDPTCSAVVIIELLPPSRQNHGDDQIGDRALSHKPPALQARRGLRGVQPKSGTRLRKSIFCHGKLRATRAARANICRRQMCLKRTVAR